MCVYARTRGGGIPQTLKCKRFCGMTSIARVKGTQLSVEANYF